MPASPPGPPARRPTSGIARTAILGVATVFLAIVLGLGSTFASSPTGASAPARAYPWPVVVAAASDPVEDRPGAAGAVTGPVGSANARFAAAAYDDLLGRGPDPSGLDFHIGRLAAGGDRSREIFAYALLFSTEGSQLEVDRAYLDLLDRGPDPTGRRFWTNHLSGHGVLDLRVLLLASDEFHGRSGGNDGAWVTALYRSILGRDPEPTGLAYWRGLAAAGTPRALIAAGVYLSDEALGRRADAYYGEALGRGPSATERARAVATIRTIGERGLRARLLASDEAFEPHLRAALS